MRYFQTKTITPPVSIPASAPARFVRFPEKREQDDRSEACTKSCPGKGDDLENRGIRVACKENTDHCDSDDGEAGQKHGCFLRQLYAEAVTDEVVGNAGSRCKQLGVRS